MSWWKQWTSIRRLRQLHIAQVNRIFPETITSILRGNKLHAHYPTLPNSEKRKILNEEINVQEKSKKRTVKTLCDFCDVSCSSSNQFKDYITPKGNKFKKEAIQNKQCSQTGNREFQNHDVLNTHFKNKGRLKTSIEKMWTNIKNESLFYEFCLSRTAECIFRGELSAFPGTRMGIGYFNETRERYNSHTMVLKISMWIVQPSDEPIFFGFWTQWKCIL